MTSSGPHLTLIRLLLCSLVLVAEPLRAQEDIAPIIATETRENGTLTVTVEGVDGPLRDNVLAHLELNRFADQAAPEESRMRWLHARAETQIREALQPFGYYEPTIASTLNRTPNGWEARYQIQPGRALRIATLDVQILGEGQQDPAFQAVLTRLPLAQGQVLNQLQYEQIKRTLEMLATERGYFNAQFTESTIRIDLEAYEATIHLHYDTGPRYRFGAITFKQDFLSPKLLNRYPRFKPGDPYDASDLLKLQGDLSGAPYFSQVQVNAPPDAATDTAPVNVELEPNKQRKYSAGLGYGTDTGARVKLRAEQRWLNRQGHHAEQELQWSTIKSLVGIKYKIPGADPTTDEYSLTAGYSQQDYNQQNYQLFTLGGGWQQQDGKWLKNYNLNYQYEQFSVGDQPTSSSLLLIPGLNWTWIDADDRLYPTRGLLFGFELRGASTALLSDLNFVQGVLRLKGVYALNDTSRFIARGDVGATVISEGFDQLPTSLRFFTGGDTSVRGYAFNSIGPTDTAGVVIGGKNLLVGSLEYEHRIWDGWSLATFVDSGDTFNGAAPELKTGVGIGLRWRSPVGPVRIDLASGLDRPPGDAFRFSFSIGPEL
ncbi:autotransporter assembly complex protein TamA [Candidatus Contendibacter odensensis]|uniref:Translocation and assembly module subunit TamA n=1 Tax=Candidatus Contendobacter odensis Run_B_J11 TaxID=1400861 RepID=A0A7U7GBH4_9GAMM|nr:autotransporter assembly complex family protein [Candidatus Contendobacter odensis]CDH45208.1 putative Surface antigen (D15) [Candidatus Contendobacter odensis Run_B_J11]